MEVVALEGAVSLTAKLCSEAFRTFHRQWVLLHDPSKECHELVKAVTVLEKAVECAEQREDMGDYLEKVEYDILKACEGIRAFKNMTARKRFLKMKRNASILRELQDRIDYHILTLDKLLLNDKGFNLSKAKEDAERELSKEYNELLKRRVDELVSALNNAVEKGDNDKASQCFFTLSVLVGEDATTTKYLQPKVLQKLHSSTGPTAGLDPWETGVKNLGPLGVKTVGKLVREGVQITTSSKSSPTYEITLESNRLAEFREALGVESLYGYLSPLARVTVDPLTRMALLVPKEAVYFSFVYPVQGLSSELEEKLTKPDLLELLLIHGGYMYFDKNKNFQQANCFYFEANRNPFVCFDEPGALVDDVRDDLLDQGRFHDVTEAGLLDQGAIKFAWINPAEKLGSASGKAWPHGAFAYIYEDEAVNNYFSIAAIADVFGVQQTAASSDQKQQRSSFRMAFGGAERAAQTAAIRDQPVASPSQSCCTIS